MNSMPRAGRFNILVIDDDYSLLTTLQLLLERHAPGQVLIASSLQEARAVLAKQSVSLIFLDIVLPDGNGLDFLEEIKKHHRDSEVIMLTANREVNSAVKAMKAGAFHYFTKDFDAEEVQLMVDKVRSKLQQDRQIASLRSEVEHIRNKEMILGRSQKSQEIQETIRKISHLSATILIQGESGTGKELLAREIHNQSGQPDAPFVTVHIASLPASLVESTLFGHEKGAYTGATQQRIGKLELADGGTLFLDEVGEIHPDIQVKLLRFLQEGEIERVGSNKTIRVQVRLISATNKNLEELVRNGNMRKDLYYRLNTIPVCLPSLRERREDIIDLAKLFLKRYCQRFGKDLIKISAEAFVSLKNYAWPGNIRELEHLIERLVAIHDSDTIDDVDLPLEYLSHEPLDVDSIANGANGNTGDNILRIATSKFEKGLITKMLARTSGNRSETARLLGVPLSTLKFKMQKLGMNLGRQKRIPKSL